MKFGAHENRKTAAAPPPRRIAVRPLNDRYEAEAEQAASFSAPSSLNFLPGSSTALPSAPSSVDAVLTQPGELVSESARTTMESRFGHDFRKVRIHADSGAAASARGLDAQAYTVGNHVVFGANRYAPETAAGASLLAHELTHVVQQSRAATSSSELALQRAPDQPTTTPTTQPVAPPAPTLHGLSRTLYVVQTDVWNGLPAAVRTSAEKELNTLFAFVGAANNEKAFSIKVVSAANLPETFDFSESVVSVIRGDPEEYVKKAFERQGQQLQAWLATQSVNFTPAGNDLSSPDPERIGFGGGSHSVITDHGKKFALPVMAGAVDLDATVTSFFDNIDSLLEKELKRVAKGSTDPAKWPATIKKGSFQWQPLDLLGQALGRAIAHETRHEYLGKDHAKKGLGESGAYIIGEKNDEQFSTDDQKAILKGIKDLETKQGNATLVPLFPQSLRRRSEQFPF